MQRIEALSEECKLWLFIEISTIVSLSNIAKTVY